MEHIAGANSGDHECAQQLERSNSSSSSSNSTVTDPVEVCASGAKRETLETRCERPVEEEFGDDGVDAYAGLVASPLDTDTKVDGEGDGTGPFAPKEATNNNAQEESQRSKTTDTDKYLNEFLGLMAEHGCIVEDESENPAIRPDDVLFVVDMQNDLFEGGTFPVKEAEHIVDKVRQLMLVDFGPTNKVFVTRDYHPIDHCSFQSEGGPFPPHCVQGSYGSFIHERITDAMKARGKGKTLVVFKGFCPDIDSLGATPYTDDSAEGRLSKNIKGMCCSSTWTGAFVLKCSNIDNDLNAPPDIMAVLNRKDVMDTIGRKPGQERPDAFICGLSFDFSVLDTALNSATNGVFRNVYIVVNATRATHMPEFGGSFGSGFVNDPEDMANKIISTGVRLIRM